MRANVADAIARVREGCPALRVPLAAGRGSSRP
jgi:hypothetical protein